jgi:RimJ/RimL family protein N-acetyltransferase
LSFLLASVESIGSGGGSDSELNPVTPEIKTEIPSLKLRLVREEDAEELFLRNDQNRGHLRQWMPWLDETKSASDTLNFIRRSLVAATAGTQYHYALLLDGELIGVVAFNEINKMDRCATIGYWLAKSKMGKGYMTAAVKALMDEGTSTIGTEPYSSAGCHGQLSKSGRLRPVRSKEGGRIAPS